MNHFDKIKGYLMDLEITILKEDRESVKFSSLSQLKTASQI